MVAGVGVRQNGSLLALPINAINFCPKLSAKLSVSNVSSSITFSPTTGTQRQTFMITNTGNVGCYLGAGMTTATAVTSSGTPAANCHFIGVGETMTLDFQVSTGIVDTIAAITASSVTTLEISLGYGQ